MSVSSARVPLRAGGQLAEQAHDRLLHLLAA
jgi:hypothetical protein